MSKKYYDLLGVDKTASADEIKKAYRKKAMKYHPDRASGDKKEAEKKFKEIGEAYDTLSNSSKRKQYDMFGSAGGSPFGGAGAASGGNTGGFGGFEDLFGGVNRGTSGGMNMEDLFGGFSGNGSSQRSNPFGKEKKPETLDFEKTYDVPFFDFILGATLDIKGVYGQNKTIKIPKGTKPGSKMRVKGFGKKEGAREGNLIIKLEAKMPKHISDMDLQMLERIKEGVGY